MIEEDGDDNAFSLVEFLLSFFSLILCGLAFIVGFIVWFFVELYKEIKGDVDDQRKMINELSDLLAEEADRVEPSFQRMAEIMYEKGYRKHKIEGELPKEMAKTSGIRVVIEDLKIVEKRCFPLEYCQSHGRLA